MNMFNVHAHVCILYFLEQSPTFTPLGFGRDDSLFIWNPLKLENNIYERFRYYERKRAAHIQEIFSSPPNQGKQEATLSLYSGRICGSEGKN